MSGLIVVDELSDLGNDVKIANLGRQYDFLQTSYIVSQHHGDFQINHRFIKELNFYAVHYLSSNPGEYRKEYVNITNTPHEPPEWEKVDQLMIDFLAELDRYDGANEPVKTAAYVLWRVNWIHPFVQGNGRTARALSYFVLCQNLNMWLPGTKIIPESIRETRPQYCEILKRVDESYKKCGSPDLTELTEYLRGLLTKQLSTPS
ncbi:MULTISPECIES: Fic family protein [unclassified Thalassospira]|uniref:Fic family protein n=1 Tax=unclassified Thalassospira TaxID=2648997 RepID=UPI0007A63606|nr:MULTISPECIES: Fic family protein [unclassified Thalassospira]